MTATAIPIPEFADLVGYGDADAIGRHVVDLTLEAGLVATDRVVDVGCGWGRVARPLTELIRPPGTYDGFDVRADFIEWAEQEISSRHPHFRFLHAPVRSGAYSPGGAHDPASYRFPYEDGSFTFALAASLFTHLTTPAFVNYTRELSRVLSPGARGLVTYFLVDEHALVALEDGRAAQEFFHVDGAMWQQDPGQPEIAVAYAEEFVLRTLRESGLEPARVEHGSWADRPEDECLTHQDVVIVTRA